MPRKVDLPDSARCVIIGEGSRRPCAIRSTAVFTTPTTSQERALLQTRMVGSFMYIVAQSNGNTGSPCGMPKMHAVPCTLSRWNVWLLVS